MRSSSSRTGRSLPALLRRTDTAAMREFALLPIIAIASLVLLIAVAPVALAIGAVLAMAERRGIVRLGGWHRDDTVE